MTDTRWVVFDTNELVDAACVSTNSWSNDTTAHDRDRVRARVANLFALIGRTTHLDGNTVVLRPVTCTQIWVEFRTVLTRLGFDEPTIDAAETTLRTTLARRGARFVPQPVGDARYVAHMSRRSRANHGTGRGDEMVRHTATVCAEAGVPALVVTEDRDFAYYCTRTGVEAVNVDELTARARHLVAA
jgi:hypothetical protein